VEYNVDLPRYIALHRLEDTYHAMPHQQVLRSGIAAAVSLSCICWLVVDTLTARLGLRVGFMVRLGLD
jgi:hypothetical protein